MTDLNWDGWLDLVVGNYVDYYPDTFCGDALGRPEFGGPADFPGTPNRVFMNRGLSIDNPADPGEFSGTVGNDRLGFWVPALRGGQFWILATDGTASLFIDREIPLDGIDQVSGIRDLDPELLTLAVIILLFQAFGECRLFRFKSIAFLLTLLSLCDITSADILTGLLTNLLQLLFLCFRSIEGTDQVIFGQLATFQQLILFESFAIQEAVLCQV